MRVLFIIAWLFLGLGAVIYHYGPGQQKLELDRIDAVMQEAKTSVSLNKYREAVSLFDEVLKDLPTDQVNVARRVQLEKAKAQMQSAKLPEARASLETLLDDLRSDESADPGLITETQLALANSQYYRTWLLRLEGYADQVWMPEIESARQHYTEINERALELGDADLATLAAEDLESAVRLARMDLQELQGLPLPNQ